MSWKFMRPAYPRECPFPHVAGSVKPMYPEEYASQVGIDNLEVTRDVMEVHAARMRPDVEEVLLPWTLEEELVAEDRRNPSRGAVWIVLNLLMGTVALVSFAVPMWPVVKFAFRWARKGGLDNR